MDLWTWLMVTSIQRQPRYSANFSFVPRLALYRGFTVQPKLRDEHLKTIHCLSASCLFKSGKGSIEKKEEGVGFIKNMDAGQTNNTIETIKKKIIIINK